MLDIKYGFLRTCFTETVMIYLILISSIVKWPTTDTSFSKTNSTPVWCRSRTRSPANYDMTKVPNRHSSKFSRGNPDTIPSSAIQMIYRAWQIFRLDMEGDFLGNVKSFNVKNFWLQEMKLLQLHLICKFQWYFSRRWQDIFRHELVIDTIINHYESLRMKLSFQC